MSRAVFAVETRTSEGDWVFNTFPVFKNWQYFIHTKNLPVTVDNLPYRMMPSLLDDKWVLQSLYPDRSNKVPLSTDNLSLPDDMDPMSRRFLDDHAKFYGVLTIPELDDFREHILKISKIKLQVYTTKENVIKYKETQELPKPCFEHTSSNSKFNHPVDIRMDMTMLSGQLLYLYEVVPKELSTVFYSMVKDPNKDVRLIYSVIV